jgi:hypothetical protein
MNETLHPDSELIDRLGGTFVVADLCKIKPPSVSEWRKSGFPPARRQFLELLRPDVFGPPLEVRDTQTARGRE